MQDGECWTEEVIFFIKKGEMLTSSGPTWVGSTEVQNTDRTATALRSLRRNCTVMAGILTAW